MIHPDFDGHEARAFAAMTAEERLEDLSAKIALVLELRRARETMADPVASSSDRGPKRT